MAKKDKRATDQLNVALAGIDSCLAVMSSAKLDPVGENCVKKAREYCEEARDALLTIQFHAAQI